MPAGSSLIGIISPRRHEVEARTGDDSGSHSAALNVNREISGSNRGRPVNGAPPVNEAAPVYGAAAVHGLPLLTALFSNRPILKPFAAAGQCVLPIKQRAPKGHLHPKGNHLSIWSSPKASLSPKEGSA